MPQIFVGTPVFREFDGATAQVAVILLQFGLEPAEQGESVGGRAGKSGQNLVLIKAPNFFGPVLDDGFAERDLSVAGHNNLVVAAHAEDGGRADAAESERLTEQFGGAGY